MSEGYLNELRDEAYRIGTQHGFTEATVAEDIALMHSELSEALEDHRNGEAPNHLWYEDKQGNRYRDMRNGFACGPLLKPCGIPSELADVIIRILHFCGKHNINIESAVVEKMQYNETRPPKHGGKTL